jgi:hypothetical protein
LESLTLSLLEKLTTPGDRLPWIKKWLSAEVWSTSQYEALGHSNYLKKGEEAVNKFESLIAASADRIYGELLSISDKNKSLLTVLSDSNTAVVIFDGLSLRELPIIQKLSGRSGFKIQSIDCAQAAVPCETLDYIVRELPCGRIGPSKLPGRGELREKGITAIYTNDLTQRINQPADNSALLVWSAFPDNTYKDSGARFESHFDNIHMQFETAWMNTVQQIKGKSRIIITSDHGYIFFGTGMDFPRSGQELRELNDYFGNDRFAYLSDKPNPPQSDDIVIHERRQLAMIKGRVKTRSTGEAAVKLYKHGGLSLMEMLTPWVVLEM